MVATGTTDTPSGTLRPRRTQAQRRKKTKAALLDATIDTLLEVGYSRTTTAQVCVRAGVSQGALFKHFPTKQALLAASVEHLYERLLSSYAAQVEPTDGLPRNSSRPSDIPQAIDALWRTFERPELMVVYELQAASRTDGDLRKLLEQAGKSHASAIRRTASELFPDAASSDGFEPLLDTVLETFQGMAMSRMISSDPAHEARVLGVLKNIARDVLADDERETEHEEATEEMK
jgi:AcrR family transcriptional regulator